MIRILRLWIIPARAGFTSGEARYKYTIRDHPRSRGVYPYRVLHRRRRRGSSPLARGLHDPEPVDGRERRIIPARAGFTSAVGPGDHHAWDHPRSRGVYSPPPPSPSLAAGSSPLARGLPAADQINKMYGRIIPARAGFTRELEEFRTAGGDHPRSRGVYRLSRISLKRSVGSSPLARGLPRTLRSDFL